MHRSRLLIAAALAVQCLLLLFPPSASYTTSLRGAKQLAAASSGSDVEDSGRSSKPWFCRGLDCPSFEVVETAGHLQLRRYRAQSFIVTRVEAGSLLQAQVIATKRLVGYLAGDNEDGIKLPPTVPLNSVLLTADRHSEMVKGHLYFAIYLPEEVQRDAPKPSNRDVRVVRIHRRSVWVDTFDSPLLTETDVIHRGWGLIKHLEAGGRKVDSRFFIFSLYEPPLPLVPHHYEIAVHARCRRYEEVPGEVVGQAGAMHGEVQDDEGDDDYPFAEEGGGDSGDDECPDDDSGADLMEAVLAAV